MKEEIEIFNKSKHKIPSKTKYVVNHDHSSPNLTLISNLLLPQGLQDEMSLIGDDVLAAEQEAQSLTGVLPDNLSTGSMKSNFQK